MTKQVVVTVLPDGTTKVDALNFQGQGCAAATEAIAIAVAGNSRDKSDDDTKPEFYQETGQGQSIY